MVDLLNSDPETFPFFDLTPDLVCIAGKDGFFKKVNPSVIQKLGYTEEELFASPIATFMHPDDRDHTLAQRTKLLEGNPLTNFQNRYLSKTGNVLWLDWTSVYFPDREVVFAIAKDVTERKQIEKEVEDEYIKFKKLATHFKSRIERDRKYFAGELHEEVAQLASVIKMDIDWISRELPELPGLLQSRVEHARAVSELLIHTIRRVSFSVSPYMLEEMGLNATLKWLCKEFTILNKIPCRFESIYDEGMLTDEIKLDFFRICQESLRNIIQHAHADSVKVSIEDMGGQLNLSIMDDGIGFDPLQEKQTSGLTSMREQAASINGRLIIQTEPGKGTTISVTIDK
jgi:PAS domain S-box-containing protein